MSHRPTEPLWVWVEPAVPGREPAADPNVQEPELDGERVTGKAPMVALAHRGRGMTAALRRNSFGHTVAQTGLFNILATVLGAGAGLLVARYLGAGPRGEYAAVVAWFGLALVVGELGQGAATCFHVARDPLRARTYVASSRSLMLTSGLIITAIGLLIAPALAHSRPTLTFGYQVMFGVCLAALAGASYVFALQARHVTRWNVVRTAQPALFFLAVLTLALTGTLTLSTVLLVLASSIVVQSGVAYLACTRSGLAPGHADRRRMPSLLRYGIAQLTATAPSAMNTRLDQLVMSLTVPAADLGRYAVSVSLTSLAFPVVAALGYVAFPRLAGQSDAAATAGRLERRSILASCVVAAAILLPLAGTAQWLLPAIFGPSFAAAAPLVWVLAPGGFFLATGQVMGDLLRARNSPWRVAHAQLAGAVVTVVALGILLPLVGVLGAAIASTASYAVTWTWQAWAWRRTG